MTDQERIDMWEQYESLKKVERTIREANREIEKTGKCLVVALTLQLSALILTIIALLIQLSPLLKR